MSDSLLNFERMNYFFDPSLYSEKQVLALSSEESRHATKVLRLSKGNAITIINGKGEKARGEISILNDKGMQVLVNEVFSEARPGYTLSIGLAVLKKRERLEWFVEKAVELAADRIVIFNSDHTEKHLKVDAERLNRIAITALKQSGNLWLPEIKVNAGFNEVVSENLKGLKFIAHCYEGDKMTLKQACKANDSITILIGPEGDFSLKEVDVAIANGFVPVSLGNLRLRAETAALAALMTMRLANQ